MTELWFFYQDDCAPCAALKPQVTQWAEELGVPVRFLDARSEDVSGLVDAWRIRSVPTVVVTVPETGRRVAGFVGGLINKESLARAIALV